MSNIIGLNTKLFGLEKNIKQSEPTRAANDLGQLGDPAEKERVLNPIVSESYMQKYIEEHGGGGGVEMLQGAVTIVNNTGMDLPFNANSTLVLSTGGNALARVEELNPLTANQTIEIDALYRLFPSDPNDIYAIILEPMFRSVSDRLVSTTSDAVNCTAVTDSGSVIIMLTNAESPSSITVTFTVESV